MSKQRPAKQPRVRSAEPPSKGRLNELLSRVPGIHNWNAEWESFQSDWREWSSRLDAKLSTYCLPAPFYADFKVFTHTFDEPTNDSAWSSAPLLDCVLNEIGAE